MENVSFCPYRTQINYDWSSIQTTPFTPPKTFRGDASDLALLEACKNPDAEPAPLLPHQVLGKCIAPNWPMAELT